MKQILFFLATILSLTSCVSTMDSFSRTVRYMNRTEEMVDRIGETSRYLASFNPNGVSKNGTEFRYKWKGNNTVLYLRWYDTEIYREGKFIIIYNTKRNYVVERLSTINYNTKNYVVRAYSPYDGGLIPLQVEVKTNPQYASVCVSYAGAPLEYYNL